MGKRIAFWLLVCAALSWGLFPDLTRTLGEMFSPGTSGRFQASTWGILALCLLWLATRRHELRQQMEGHWHPLFLVLGVALAMGAALLPGTGHLLVFRVLLASLGVFVLLFGRAGRLPAMALGIYGLGIALPLGVERFAEVPVARASLHALLTATDLLGYPFHSQGQWLLLDSTTGQSIRVVVTAACAGPATMGVMIAFFALMTLDFPLPRHRVLPMLLLAVIGTWAQSLLRLFLLLAAGYHLGESALWTMHLWTIYLLFPAWFLLYAWLYFRQLIPGKLPPVTAGGKE